MLRPHKNGNCQKQSALLPVTTTMTPSPIHHYHLHHHHRRNRLGEETTTATTAIKIKVMSLVLMSVVLVFVVATRSTTRNLDLQQQETFRQEEGVVNIKNHHQHSNQQRRRSMTEAATVDDNNDDKAATAAAVAVAYDLVIVGAGPAGLTASLFGARAGLSVLVLGSTASSQLYQASILDNFPGFFAATASSSIHQQQQLQQHQDWLKTTQMQAAAVGVHFALSGLTVNRIRLPTVFKERGGSGIFGVELSTHEPTTTTTTRNTVVVAARSVIVATGAVEERLHLPGEDALWAKSVHSCAICDGSLYVDKTVVVVGGGDAAVEAALLLSRFATQVYMVHRRTWDAWRASDQSNLQTLQELDNVQLLTPFVVQAYDVSASSSSSSSNGGSELVGVVLQHATTKMTQTIACHGVFVMIGSKPNTNFIKDNTPPLKLDPEGYLMVVSNGGDGATSSTTTITTTATSVPGIFAAGQVVDKTYRQAITAAASGAQAAIDAERWLRQQYSSSSSASVGVTQQRQRLLPVVPLQTIEFLKPQQPEARQEEKQESLQHDASQGKGNFHVDCDLTEESCITSVVNKSPVVVFSKSYCPYCKKALAVLEVEGVTAGGPFLHVIDLTQRQDGGRAVQAALQKMTGRATVPNVFVGGMSIGGGDETSQLHREGKLKLLLNAALAFAVTN